METGLVKAEEYGLTPENGTKIEQEFAVITTEQSGLIEVYEGILKAELCPETEEKARVLSNKLSKLNASNNAVHKVQKAYYLAGGEFVDALKNKNKTTIAEMQDRLEQIKNHSKRIEEERIQDLHAKRIGEVSKYVEEVSLGINFGTMEDDVWEAYFLAKKKSYEDSVAATKVEEDKRKAEVEAERKRVEAIRVENEKLRKDAEVERKKVEAERKRIADARAKEQAKANEILKAQRAEAEKQRIADEAKRKILQDKADKLEAEAEAESKRLNAEIDKITKEKAQIRAKEEKERAAEQEKLDEMSDADILTEAVKSITFPDILIQQENVRAVGVEIKAKLDAYKNWAVKLIDEKL